MAGTRQCRWLHSVCCLLTLLLVAPSLALRPTLVLQHSQHDESSSATSRQASVWQAAHGSHIDLLGAMSDSPPGAFYEVMGPVTQAISLSYNTTLGSETYDEAAVNKTIDPAWAAGEAWERVYDLEADPQSGGVHARVFASVGAKRIIVAFRGICSNQKGLEQCEVDACFGLKTRGFGKESETFYNTTAESCVKYEDQMDYAEQAAAIVRRVQERYPDYGVLLAGHSLGGFLATVTAARQPGVLQAITVAPTPFHYSMTEFLNFTEAQIAALPTEDLVAACDKFDCGYSSTYMMDARKGATTCLYKELTEPPICKNLVEPYEERSWKLRLQLSMTGAICKTVVHQWPRYEELIFKTEADGVTPANLPSCNLTYSTL